jgi:hypothetical protein
MKSVEHSSNINQDDDNVLMLQRESPIVETGKFIRATKFLAHYNDFVVTSIDIRYEPTNFSKGISSRYMFSLENKN